MAVADLVRHQTDDRLVGVYRDMEKEPGPFDGASGASENRNTDAYEPDIASQLRCPACPQSEPDCAHRQTL